MRFSCYEYFPTEKRRLSESADLPAAISRQKMGAFKTRNGEMGIRVRAYNTGVGETLAIIESKPLSYMANLSAI